MDRLKVVIFSLSGLALAAAAAGTIAASPQPPWRIALSSNRGDSEIYSMNADGSGVRRLTRTPGVTGRPVLA